MSTKATAYTMLVGKTATCMTDGGSATFTRVVAGSANLSLLYSKLANAAPACGMQMPLGQNPLSTAQLAQVAAWINAQAPNN